jgi:hypothetical protein
MSLARKHNSGQTSAAATNVIEPHFSFARMKSMIQRPLHRRKLERATAHTPKNFAQSFIISNAASKSCFVSSMYHYHCYLHHCLVDVDHPTHKLWLLLRRKYPAIT